MSSRPLIAHVVHRFDVGGLENGVVNLINRLPADEFRHAIIALTEVTDFSARLRRSDVVLHALHKRPGKDPSAYLRLYRLLRKLRPGIVHTRNLGTIDCQLMAALAGIRLRIHGEHGWDIHDPDGTNRRYRALRRMLNPVIHRFATVSRDLERWLIERVGIPPRKVLRICNGVDTERFRPPGIAETADTAAALPADRFPPGAVIVGSVTRFEPIKDPLNLVRAFIEARRRLAADDGGIDLRLLMLGDGPLRGEALERLEAAGEAQSAWLPGGRDDVAAWLRAMHCYALGSRREGISNTVLEAMASGLPVVATRHGGIPEAVTHGVDGLLVAEKDAPALAEALCTLLAQPELLARFSREASRAVRAAYGSEAALGAMEDCYAEAVAPVRPAP